MKQTNKQINKQTNKKCIKQSMHDVANRLHACDTEISLLPCKLRYQGFLSILQKLITYIKYALESCTCFGDEILSERQYKINTSQNCRA